MKLKIQKMQRIKHLIHNHKKMHDYPQDETLILIIIKMKDIHNYSQDETFIIKMQRKFQINTVISVMEIQG